MSSKLSKKNKFIKDKSDDKLQYIKMNTERYIDRIDFVISFLSFLNHAKSQFHTKPGVYGSFIRKIFEFPYALLEFINSDENDWKKYGNFMDGDIDFYIQKHESNCKSENELREIVNKLDIQLGIYLATKQEDLRPVYGKYHYMGSTNTSEYFNLEMNVQ